MAVPNLRLRLHFRIHHLTSSAISPSTLSSYCSLWDPKVSVRPASLSAPGSIRRYCVRTTGGSGGVGAHNAAASLFSTQCEMVASDSESSDIVAPHSIIARGLDSELGVGTWAGRAVFVDSSPGPSNRVTSALNTNISAIARFQASSGTPDSPISITSSPSSSSSGPPSPDQSHQPSMYLPRPRAVPSYTSPIARTAYTSPKPFPSSPARQNSTPAGAVGARVHPFFKQTFARSRSTPMPHTPPPPASQRPRMVAHYSSTSESQGSTATNSTFGSQSQPSQEIEGSPSVRAGQRNPRPVSGIEKGKGKARGTFTETEIDNLAGQVDCIDLTGKFRPNPADGRQTNGKSDWKWKGKNEARAEIKRPGGSALSRYGRPGPDNPVKGKQGSTTHQSNNQQPLPYPQSASSSHFHQQSRHPGPHSSKPESTHKPPATNVQRALPTRPVPAIVEHIDPADYFSHTQYSPAPEIVYTTSLREADALLSRLQGQVLGLDLEWPMAGWYRTPEGKKVPIGMTWNVGANKWDYGQGRTALIQICDERLIVLIHLKEGNNMVLPQKVIDIMQDKEVYKCGVSVKGDGLKLNRDFPTSFPIGISGLLELTNVARRVDPIKTGPGSLMISLAKLTKEYTGKTLEKDDKVRKSNWLFDLDDKQIQYAANDVYAGLQVYLRLKQMGADRKIPMDLDTHSGVSKNVSQTSKPAGVSPGSASTGVSDLASHSVRLAPGFHKYPPPRQLNALAAFKSGTTIKAFATEGDIKTATVEGYICDALAVLANETLDKEEMARFIPQIKDIRVRRKFKILIARMRRMIGEEDVNSEATMPVSDTEEDEGNNQAVQGDDGSTDKKAEVGLSKAELDSLGDHMGRLEVSSEAELEWHGDDMLDGEHGWTREEVEEAMRLRDSDGDYDTKR